MAGPVTVAASLLFLGLCAYSFAPAGKTSNPGSLGQDGCPKGTSGMVQWRVEDPPTQVWRGIIRSGAAQRLDGRCSMQGMDSALKPRVKGRLGKVRALLSPVF